MTEQTDLQEDVNAVAEEGQQEHVGGEKWKERALRAESDAAKYRAQRKQLAEEKKALESKVQNSQDDDYKALWQQEQAAKNTLLARVKASAVESALTARLTKAGVLPDALDAAAKLVDLDLVEWDEENGVEEASANAAVAKLKSQFGFMFEKKVAKTEPKQPADGSTSNANEIKRSDFNKLDPFKRMEHIQKGTRVVD